MPIRSIIEIDEDLCTGCGDCIPNCPEGAIRIIDGKARIVSDIFCDGLGACLGHCPEGAITVIEREAEPYDEMKVMANVVKQGPNTIKTHLDHMIDHGETEYYNQAIEFLKMNNIAIPGEDESVEEPLACGCPGAVTQSLAKPTPFDDAKVGEDARSQSQLTNWPVQLRLVNPSAQYLKDAKLLIAADCTAFACGSLHPDFMKGRVTLIGCPKLDDRQHYVEKIASIIQSNDIQDILLLIMEVPCCGGLRMLVNEAISRSGKSVPVKGHILGINGKVLESFES